MSNEVLNNIEESRKQLSVLEYMKQPKIKERLQQALGKKANVEEFLSNVLVEIGKNQKLMQCTFDSILQCAIDSANFGLIPNKQLGHAWLIPYENSYKDENNKYLKRMECQLQIGYKGYIKKFSEYGMNIEVELVTTEEIDRGFFTESRGSKPFIKHFPIRKGIRTQKNIECGYAIGRCEGRKDIIVVMSLEEIMEAAKTEQWNSDTRQKEKSLKGAWTNNARETDFAEMCKKTLIRRLSKHSDIDVVTKISSFEGERDEALKDVTPNNDDLQLAFLSKESINQKADSIPANKLDELLSSHLTKAQSTTNGINSLDNTAPAQLKMKEIIALVHEAKTDTQLKVIITNNESHILAMPQNLQDMVFLAIEEKKTII